jgi:hypothetical protein
VVVWTVDLGRLPLRWREHGDAWYHQLVARIRLGSSSTDGGGDERLFDRIVFEAGDPRVRSSLDVARDAQGWIVCTVHGDEDEPPEDQVGPWREAVAAAAAGVVRGGVATWNAVLGPQPQRRTSYAVGVDDRPRVLATETCIGPVRLIPAGVYMHEMVAQPRFIGADRYPFSSWPLIVEGTAACYGERPGVPEAWWPMDHRAALRDVHRAAALVSLAWHEHWSVRQEPARITPDQRLTVPHLAGDHTTGQWSNGCTMTPDQEATQGRVDDPPEWLTTAWEPLQANPALSEALDAYYEAVQIDAEHPSAAVLLYVTVIEGVGTDLTRLAPLRAKASFRAALRTIMSESDTATLTRWAYSRRSATAHCGVLHGAESTLGWLPDSDFYIDEAEVFEEDELAEIHRAARDVLIHALTPATTALQP